MNPSPWKTRFVETTMIGCFALLIISPRSGASAIAIALALAGLALAVRFRVRDPADKLWLLILSIPFCSYALNMLLTGWDAGELDRPAHLIYAFLVYLLLRHYRFSAQALGLAAAVGAFAAGCVTAYDIFVKDLPRATGQWNSVPFGNFSLLLSAIAGVALCSLQYRNKSLHAIMWLGILGGVSASIGSGTRGGWIAAPFLVYIATFSSTCIKRHNRATAVLAAAMVIVTAVLFSPIARDRIALAYDEATSYLSNPDDLNQANSSVGVRLAMWRWGIDSFIENPVLGIGQANFESLRKAAIAHNELPEAVETFASLHNQVISDLATCGLLGLIALVSFWVLSWRYYWTRLTASDPDLRSCATSGLLTVGGTALFSMTDSLFGTGPGTLAFAMLHAACSGSMRSCESSRDH